MMKPYFSNQKSKVPILISILLLATACTESKYQHLVRQEMAKEIRYDSIFLGHRFGQTKQEFFDICWQLNHNKIVTHGPKNSFVEYGLRNEDPTLDMRMLFYGIFNEEKIMTGMDLEFSYYSWSLWNKQLQPEKLVLALQDTLQKWYPGNDFVRIKSKKLGGDILVKIDANRRIIIEPINDAMDVHVRMDDLRHKNN